MQLFLMAAGLFALMPPAPDAKGESVTLTPVADTTLLQSAPANNLGASTMLLSGASSGDLGGPFGALSRALLHFDVASQVPSTATVTSVTLTVRVTRTPLIGGVNSTFGLHKVLQAWGEGDNAGDPNVGQTATPGEATWNARQHPSPLWASPGGEPGVDYMPGASASKLITGVATHTFESTSNLVADVQSWLNSSNSNSGWILISDDEASPTTVRGFGSREAGTNGPSLLIQYTTQTIAPTITQAGLANGQITFQFDAQALTSYTVQFNDSLASSNWLSLTNITPQPAATNIVVTEATTNSQRFYRISTP
ncbi:MAG TPA: hypothetical protein VJW76_11210 [Verrucomicrobiae bacterium]|nr:hypothetical protein [Verrucomicrobiae bacterium]